MPTAENRAQPAPPARVNDYDSFAETYSALSELCAALLSGAGSMPGRSVEFSPSPLRAPRLTVAARQVPGQVGSGERFR
ncbi:hypothetical protein [Streptomyces sp. NPDC089795]|uniref:hypothetical protein n=1 Tax=Streptomyces sp. NPDC089795 TaxID=3155297 RepID=UPI0034447C94